MRVACKLLYNAGKFMSERTLADVWDAEGCAFTSACETHAKFDVPGALNTPGPKAGSVTAAANAGSESVTASEPGAAATARQLGDKFGCQLSFASQQARLLENAQHLVEFKLILQK